MKKPIEPKYKFTPPICIGCDYRTVYDNWSKYHTWRMGQLPGKKELLEILENTFQMVEGVTIELDGCKREVSFDEIAEAIDRRIREGAE